MSSSKSEQQHTNTTEIETHTTNTTAVGGPAVNLTHGDFAGKIGLTGEDAVAAVDAFHEGAVQIEQARTKQMQNIFSGLGTLASSGVSHGGGIFQGEESGNGDENGDGGGFGGVTLFTLLAGAAAMFTVVTLSKDG